MRTVRVLLVTQWYDPEPIAQPRWIADALEGQGFDVAVLTGIPNYPHGRVAHGYRASRTRTDCVGNRAVYRTPLYPSHDTNGFSRMVNYTSWALSASVFGLRRFRQADVSMVYSSPATAALPAMIANRMFKIPYVLVVQDLWPDTVFASGLLPRYVLGLRQLLDRFVSLSYRWASSVVVISPGMKTLLVSRGVSAAKIDVVYNWVEPTIAARPVEALAVRARLGIEAEAFVLMYAGNHGAAQNLGTVIEGITRAVADRPVRLILVGDGVEKEQLRELAEGAGRGRVTFLGQVPRDELPRLMAAANVQLVSLANDRLFTITTPSKLQSIMAAGYPVLASASGDVADLVQEAGAGVSVPPGQPDELARVIGELSRLSPEQLAEFGANGNRFYEDRMSESVGAARLRTILLLATGRVPEDGDQ